MLTPSSVCADGVEHFLGGGPQACTAEGQAAEETWGSRMALKSEVFSAPGRQPIRGQTLTVELKLRGSQGQGSPL